mmetsp:Transcript_30105/g.83045  ORF Transcript_30105/g.83045 Transcript_30105/m.83045 type:complete len:228 (+) Transcript_30105:944-1627(+)
MVERIARCGDARSQALRALAVDEHDLIALRDTRDLRLRCGTECCGGEAGPGHVGHHEVAIGRGAEREASPARRQPHQAQCRRWCRFRAVGACSTVLASDSAAQPPSPARRLQVIAQDVNAAVGGTSLGLSRGCGAGACGEHLECPRPLPSMQPQRKAHTLRADPEASGARASATTSSSSCLSLLTKRQQDWRRAARAPEPNLVVGHCTSSGDAQSTAHWDPQGHPLA